MKKSGILLALVGLILITVSIAAARAAQQDAPQGPSHHLIVQTRIDHFTEGSDAFDLYVEFGAPFDEAKPTVFFIADGQQFFIRPNAMSRYQERYFGDAFNVVGIMGRGADYEALRSRIAGPDGSTTEPDWKEAWRLYRSEQWVEDIETVRRALLGAQGKIMLFGRSGGAYLAHQYIAAYGDHVSRAFTSAPAATPFADFAGVTPDHFWTEIAEADPAAQARIQAILARPDTDREKLAMTFQRQNFFVSADDRAQTRLDLLQAFEDDDTETLAAVYSDYQVDAVLNLNNTPRGWPVRVRLFEFAAPFANRWRIRTDRLDPDIEVMLSAGAPLLQLLKEGEISFTPIDVSALHEKTETEIFVLAGRWDHIVDYRASIALAASYPKTTLFIADDTHVFPTLVEAGVFNLLLQTFLLEGPKSIPFHEAVAEADPFRWREYE